MLGAYIDLKSCAWQMHIAYGPTSTGKVEPHLYAWVRDMICSIWSNLGTCVYTTVEVVDEEQ